MMQFMICMELIFWETELLVSWPRELLTEETRIGGELAEEVEAEDQEAEAEIDAEVTETGAVQCGWTSMVHPPGLTTGSLWRTCHLE